MKKMTGMKPLLLTFCAVGVLSSMNPVWAADVVTNCAQVSKANETDIDSDPGNKTEAELLSGFNAEPKTLEDDEACSPVTIEAIPTYSIGNLVWIDADNSGDATVGEVGVGAGVKLILKDDGGVQVGEPVETDTEGRYLFSDLAAGDYQVCILKENFEGTGKLVGYLPSTGVNQKIDPDDSDEDEHDNGEDTVEDGICSNTFTLNDQEPLNELGFTNLLDGDDGKGTPDNRSNLTVDFGVRLPPPPTVSVGDTIWEDVDGDGKQGGVTDKLLANVTVTLKKADGSPAQDINGVDVAAQQTDVNGNYQFVNLPEGDYLIEVTKPAGYDFTKINEGTDGKIDSNCTADGKISGINLAIGAEIDDGDDDANNDPTQDCGLVKLPTPSVSVGDTIWEDVDGDGKQGGVTDKLLANVTVTLKKADGSPAQDINGVDVAAQQTDVNGNYQFVNLPEGDYLIEVTKPAGYDFTKINEGTDGKIDSNCTADGKISGINLAIGAEIDDGDDDANNDPTQDCGLVKLPTPSVSVGDTIWEDVDGDGKQGGVTDKLLANVTVTLKKADGSPAQDINGVDVAAQQTDVNGNYQFVNLPEGDYLIEVTKPAGYDFTKINEGTDGKIDSNCTADGKISGINLAIGAEIDDGDDDANNDPTQDCGLIPTVAPTYSIGNRVWIDADNSGDANVGEENAGAGIKLILKDDGGITIGDTETDAHGRYLFSGLGAGSYQVCVLAENFAVDGKLAGYLASTGPNQKENPNIGGVDNRGIDGDDNGDDDVSGDICTNLVELNDEEPLNELGFTDNNDGDDGKSTPDNRSNLTIDFGVVSPPKKSVSVGDYIWIDADQDGLQDPEELPLKGAEVTLLNKDGSPVVIGGDMAIPSQITGEDGKYLFSDLPEGEYIIKVQAVGYTLTKSVGDPDSNAANNDSNCEADLGGTEPFSLMAGQESEVDGDDANGDLTIDCGFYPTPIPVVKHSLGNKVWIDDGNGTAVNANNGQMDTGEKPVVDGVRMELWNTTEPSQNLASTTTVNGFYLFDNLEAGDYRVCIAPGNFAATGLLANYTASTGGNELDPNDDVDNNDNGDDVHQDGICNTTVITLGVDEPTGETDTANGKPGEDGKGTVDEQSNLTLDFGVLPPPAEPETVAVGDKMWVDLDGDGKQDPGEPGLGDVTVKLLDKEGNVIATQVTKPDGSYFFDNLPEGEYRIVAIPPSLYNIFTKSGGSVDDNSANDDSNCAADGSTSLFTLKAGTEPTDDGDSDANTNRSVDCGFVPHVQIPTANTWGLAIMSMLLAVVAFFRRRRED
ncbi:SdrD B-like domain-containing protein [Candidatus Thiothrix anitrata]|uniref:IPTL-CTERM protein sorting domain-containing protein n=1 Tax=Candidatus Thiothrix anitrata TaxID=2823902 RepID=A0ABX7X7Z0_9GAMM|nr:SdrD B-like domain-containing protein [Candidatus Thiothrix anitrata]QTR49965.1 hypothetical protein J8380_17370 [Candidatus Thiothrix anitrata]